MRILLHLLASLPLIVLQGLGKLGGWLLWTLNSSRRKVGLHNIARCMPELPVVEQHRIVRESLAHELMTYLETPFYWLGRESLVKSAVREWRGIDALDRAFAKGRGVILLTLHMGAFEAVAIPMSATYPFYGIYKPQKGAVNDLSVRGRSRFGGHLVPTVGGVRQAMLPVLAQGFGVYYMPDHDPPLGRGLFAPFMGIPAHTPTLVARLVRESGAPVVFLYGERLPRARGYIAHYLDAPEDICNPDPKIATAAMNRGLEACVRACPEQYWWSYKRFRRRPEGEPAFYS